MATDKKPKEFKSEQLLPDEPDNIDGVEDDAVRVCRRRLPLDEIVSVRKVTDDKGGVIYHVVTNRYGVLCLHPDQNKQALTRILEAHPSDGEHT